MKKTKKKAARAAQARRFATPRKPERLIRAEGFITDMGKLLISPVRFFANIKLDGKYEDTIVKTLIYGLLAAGIEIVFNISTISLLDAMISALLLSVGAVLASFALAGIALFFSYLAKGEMSFERAVKAVASCIFIYPLGYLLYKISFAYPILFFASLGIDLYIVFLLYNLVIYALKGYRGVARATFGIFAAFVIVIHFSKSSSGYLMLKNHNVAMSKVLSGAIVAEPTAAISQ